MKKLDQNEAMKDRVETIEDIHPITFYTPCKTPRPIRTSAFARRYAQDALAGRFGADFAQYQYIDMSDITDLPTRSPYDQYDLSILRVAQRAPLRIVKGELLVGSATVGAAIRHRTPTTFDGKEELHFGTSHLTCNFDRVLREGLDSFRDRILQKMEEKKDDAVSLRCLQSFLHVYQAIKLYHERYLYFINMCKIQATSQEDKAYYQALYDNLEHVPFQKPKTFREGVQALWFTFSFIRLEGNWPGIGRIDWMLGDLLKHDLNNGVITLDEARELLAHFFIKGVEWCDHLSRGSGDAQHYQNLVLGGIDQTGNDISNEVTRLIYEIIEEYPISDYPIAVRYSKRTPDWAKEAMARAMRHGSGVIALYNEDLVINALRRMGYAEDEIWQFANDGCWEVQIPGKTNFQYFPFDVLKLCQDKVFGLGQHGAVTYDSYEALFDKYLQVIDEYLTTFRNEHDAKHHIYDQATLRNPQSTVSFFEDDCIDNARDYYCGGVRYVSLSPHPGGMPDLANNLYAIKKLVFDDKKVTYPELIRILENDWEGHEDLRLFARNNYVYYGNDNDEVDTIMADVVAGFIKAGTKERRRDGVIWPMGISTFGRQIEWKDQRYASADGFKRGDILSGNVSPTPSTDFTGATAIIKSCCKADYTDLACGTVLDIKLDPSCINGEEGVNAIISLMDGFTALGGFFLQVDVVDNEVLKEAQKHPENFQSLAVRVSGWSARFVTLDEEWQKMIIERSEQKV